MEKTTQLSNLIVDRVQNKTVFAKEKAEQFDVAIRNKLLELFNLREGERLSYNVWEMHKHEMFAIISEVLQIQVPVGIMRNPFLEAVAEFRNLAEGATNQFIVPDTAWLTVSRFSGNHWNVDRQRLMGRRSFIVPTEWFYVAIYEDIDRILQNIITAAEMFEKIQASIEKGIYERIFASWNGAVNYLPDNCKESGTFDRDSMLNLVETIQTATQQGVAITGTRQALALMYTGTTGDPSAWMSNAMKDEMNNNGFIGSWNGVKTIVIPQAFLNGTYDFAINNKTLRVIPDTDVYKPIKIVHEGDYRIRNLEYHETEEQQLFYQTQFKMGVATVFANLYGEYTIS